MLGCIASQPTPPCVLSLGEGKMSRRLAVESTLEEIEKEARVLLHHLQQGDVAACKQYNHLDPEAGDFQPRLADAQYAIARKYDSKSWKELRKRLTRNAPGN